MNIQLCIILFTLFWGTLFAKEESEINSIIEDRNRNSEESNDKKADTNESNTSEDEKHEFFEPTLDQMSLLPDPDELYEFLFTEDESQVEQNKMIQNVKATIEKGGGSSTSYKRFPKETFVQLYDSALEHFDIDGYSFLMETIMQKNYGDRFTQKVKKMNESYAHCDMGSNTGRSKRKGGSTNVTGPDPIYPGGPVRATYGTNLSKWMKESLENVESAESMQVAGLSNLVRQSLTMVKGLIQSVASSVVDIVPPLIPPPVWINRPLPCLPMVTGKNCLGSILYPITAAEFVTADITDSIMNGVIASFPSKYAAKVGKTSDTQYRICAMAYLGMYCASLFPICWLPIGLRVAETFPICFPQCLATLIACPGFWLQDIEGPCSSVSVPPFCSFSIFINQKIVPPQLTSYDQSHSFPSSCPPRDEQYDTPDELYERDSVPDIFEKDKGNYHNPKLPTYPSLVADLSSHEEEGEETEPCKCMELIEACRGHFGIPIVNHVLDGEHVVKYETPVKVSPRQSKCCNECKPIWAVLYPKKTIIKLK